mgnify:CR=1 FL=1
MDYGDQGMVKMKRCSKCGLIKSYSNFYVDKSRKDGLTYDCKECRKSHRRSYYMKTKNTKYMKEYNKQYYKENKTKEHNRYLEKTYGITYKEKIRLLELQNYKCAICGKDLKTRGNDTNIDHNHDTGDVRGILCTRCNTLLGWANESIEILMRAVYYLKKYNGNPQ